MMKTILAALLTLSLQSCLATSADIDDVRGYLDTGLGNISAKLVEVETGQATYVELLAEVEESGAATIESIEAKMKEIAARGGAIGNAVKENWAEILMALLLGGAGTVGTAVKVTNALRDGNRSRRGEPVGKPAVPRTG